MPVTSNTIIFPCGDGFSMSAYRVQPQGSGPFPAIIFVYEALGLNAEMKRIATEIASAGYVVLIPNLFDRGNQFACLIRLFSQLKAGHGQGVDDLLAARAWLCSQPVVDAERLATMGFCLGGGFALLLAKTGLFKAAADFYGLPPQSLEGACPIVASVGSNDQTVMPTVPALETELKRLEIPHDLKVYPQAGHGFMNRMPNKVFELILRYAPTHGGYEPAIAADATQRLLNFLSVHV